MAATAARGRPDTSPTIPALAASAILLAAIAGCGDPSSAPPAGEPPSPTATSARPGEPLGGGSPAEFPISVPEYAYAAVAAWAAPDLLRLADLTTPEVHNRIIDLPGPPNQNWAFLQCEDEASAWACAFYNADGDYLVLILDGQRLGEPRAVVDLTFEPTAYPATARAYAEAFITAWQTGNRARMAALATAEATAAFDRLAPTPVPDYQVDEEGDPLVGVVVVLDGTKVEMQLSVALLGGPHAIRNATPVVD